MLDNKLKVNKLKIAKRIRDARKEAGLTQTELGSILFIDQSHLSYIEKGKVSVNCERLVEFANALNKPILYFF